MMDATRDDCWMYTCVEILDDDGGDWEVSYTMALMLYHAEAASTNGGTSSFEGSFD